MTQLPDNVRAALPLGTVVKPYGKISAVQFLHGPFAERYYFLIDRHKTVSYMPASTIEPMHDAMLAAAAREG